MIRPTLRTALLLALGIPVAVLPALFGDRTWVAWLFYCTVCLLAVGVDAVLVAPRRAPAVLAVPPTVLYIGSPETMTVEIRFRSRPLPAKLEAVCEVGPLLDSVPQADLAVNAGRGSWAIALVPRRRGEAAIPEIYLGWTGPLGLMRFQVRRALDLRIPIVPDVQSVRRAALRFFGSKDPLSGEKQDLYQGDGSEFERMREFVPGLDHRAMDWKASARHRKLLCREFRAERNHQIVLALDTGHLMSEPLAGIPKLDHAINAALLLTYFSLKAGDRVGLYGFDKGPNVYVAPQSGMGAFSRLQVASAGLAYSTEETNFTLGLAELSIRLRRRSLIVLLTDFVDTVTAELLVDDLERLAGRHLVVFVAVGNPEIGSVAGARPGTVSDMARSMVASDLLRDREIVLHRLRRSGIQALDATPEGISPELVNRYLDIKRRELIA